VTIDKFPFASYVVRVVQPGFGVAREEVVLSSRAPERTLSFQLRAAGSAGTRSATPRPAPPSSAAAPRQGYTGSVYVDSRPQGARVFIDNKFVGTTPLRVPEIAVGSHVVRLELAEHRTWSTSKQVVAGETARVTGSLERIQ
jgi:hypothetical protein